MANITNITHPIVAGNYTPVLPPAEPSTVDTVASVFEVGKQWFYKYEQLAIKLVPHELVYALFLVFLVWVVFKIIQMVKD